MKIVLELTNGPMDGQRREREIVFDEMHPHDALNARVDESAAGFYQITQITTSHFGVTGKARWVITPTTSAAKVNPLD